MLVVFIILSDFCIADFCLVLCYFVYFLVSDFRAQVSSESRTITARLFNITAVEKLLKWFEFVV